MGGVISGMDIAEALGGLPSSLNSDAARRLLVIAERNYLTAYIEQQSDGGET